MPSASSQKQIPLRHCVISAPAHSKAPAGSMYRDEPVFENHHHQPPQSLPPMQVATTLWPQQTSNYWFPNWRELFHGFIVVQGSQPRQAAVSSFDQNETAAVRSQHDTRSSAASPTSCSTTQYSHLGTHDLAQSTHRGAQLARQQQISSRSPASDAHASLPRFDHVTQLPHPRGTAASHTAADQLPPTLILDRTQKGGDHIACPSLHQEPGTLIKYTIKSPFWLPQGWVTEMRMRSTGTAADKFYKHVASGRRFRSRNEVLHFIRTGKGPRAAELSPSGATGLPHEQHIYFSADGNRIPGPENLQLQQLKRPAEEDKTQKLPVKKKPKTLKTGTEAEACKMPAEGRNESSKDAASHKSAQLGREIQAAHRTMVQMSKEMQATAEKFSQEIRKAQKDVESGGDLRSLPGAPAEMAVNESINKADAGKVWGNSQEASPMPCAMMVSSSVLQAAPHWAHIATINQAKWPDSAVNFVPQVVQKPENVKREDPKLDVAPQATHSVTPERSHANDYRSHAIQPAIWPDMASHQATQITYGSHAAQNHVDTLHHATQPAENGAKAVQSHVVAPIHVMEASNAGNVMQPAVWPTGVLGHSAFPQCAVEIASRIETTHRPSDMSSYHTAKQAAQVDCVGMGNIALVVHTPAAALSPLQPASERPVCSIGYPDAPALACASSGNVVPQQARERPSDPPAGGRATCGMMGLDEEAARQKYLDDRNERHLRRKKFAAVLNPKLDLSRLNPALTARQRGKVVQRMKTRHARELLAALGLHLCRKAIRRTPWLSCTKSEGPLHWESQQASLLH